MAYELRLYKDELEPGGLMPVGRNETSVTAIYVVTGSLRLRSEAAKAVFSFNSACYVQDAAEISAGDSPTLALRWELALAGTAPFAQPAPGVSTKSLLNAPLSLDRGKSYLLRSDRVDFPPGGVAFLHTHQGGGIRCLLAGSIEIETQGARHGYGPLEAWFEAGPDPVFASASATEASAFVRLMILPRSLVGTSSLLYVNADDLAKPKSQRYQVFIDAPIELPHRRRDPPQESRRPEMLKKIFECACVAGALAASTGVLAQGFPNKPIRIVVPFSPGGNVDIIGSSPAESDAYIKEDFAKWFKVVKDAGIKAD